MRLALRVTMLAAQQNRETLESESRRCAEAASSLYPVLETGQRRGSIALRGRGILDFPKEPLKNAGGAVSTSPSTGLRSQSRGVRTIP